MNNKKFIEYMIEQGYLRENPDNNKFYLERRDRDKDWHWIETSIETKNGLVYPTTINSNKTGLFNIMSSHIYTINDPEKLNLTESYLIDSIKKITNKSNINFKLYNYNVNFYKKLKYKPDVDRFIDSIINFEKIINSKKFEEFEEKDKKREERFRQLEISRINTRELDYTPEHINDESYHITKKL